MIYSLSHPRSGANWLRYCVEYLTHRPTSFLYGSLDWDPPIYTLCDNITITDKKIILKYGHKMAPSFLKQEDKLIFLLRDYKKSAFSNLIRTYPKSFNWANVKFELDYYLNSLQIYDKFVGDKILIRYEDLISGKSLDDIMKFMGFDIDVTTFLLEIDSHQQKSMSVYRDGKLKNKKIYDLTSWDEYMKKNILYEKYF
tara:strand:- start:437 stop:1030 length:594 start_codon:yes stop_codon:yes gene_type:complete